MANGVFGYEFKQCRVAKVIYAFEFDMLADEIGVLLQESAQTLFVASIEQLDGAAKNGVCDALVNRFFQVLLSIAQIECGLCAV